jgi:hypothetical protein
LTKGPYQRYGVDYAINPGDLVFLHGEDGKVRVDYDLLVYVYDANGDLLNWFGSTHQIAASAEEMHRGTMRGILAHAEVSVPVKGENFLRIAVHDRNRDHYGAVEVATSQVRDVAPADAAAGTAPPAMYELTIDATNQPGSPVRGRGPFPGSALPGHSAGLPVRLDLVAPNGTTLVDFIITNIGTQPIGLPISLDGNNSSPRTILTLYLTSDAIEYGHFQSGEPIFPFQPTSAALYSQSGDPKTFYSLAPGKAIRVHAPAGIDVKPGTHSLTAHAELLTEVVSSSGITSEELGTAEAIPVVKTFSAPGPGAR